MSRVFVFSIILSLLFIPTANALNIGNIEEAVLEQDFRKVRVLSDALLQEGPSREDQDEIEYYLGLSYFYEGDYVKAQEMFSKLAKVAMGQRIKDRAHVGLFDVAYVQEDYRKARKIVNKLLKRSAESEIASLIYLKAARANLKLADWGKAREYLKKITDNYPSSLEYHVARQLLEEKQYFAVQVGAFLERERAEQLMADLMQEDQYAYIVQTTDQKNQTFYRVRVGQITELNNAQALKSKLAKLGYPTRIFP